MPTYQVETDHGTYQVELDQEPQSDQQLHDLVTQHLGGQTAPQQSEQSLSTGDVLKGAAKNFIPSAIEAGKSIYQAVRHPLDTAGAIGDVAAGGIEKLTDAQVQPEAQKFDALMGMLKDRYGGIENTKKTIATDPAGFLMDLSTVLGGGGSLLKGAGEISKLGTLEKVGALAEKASGFTNPISLAGKGAELVMPSNLPERIYASSIKGLSSLKPYDRASRITTGLKEAILPTDAGLAKIQKLQTGIRKQVSDIIDAGFKAGDTIDTREIVTRLDGLRDTYSKLPGSMDPQGLLDDLNKLEDKFLGYEGLKIDVKTAQEAKKIANNVLEKQYNDLKFNIAEGQKQINRGYKEELEKLYPELKRLNPQDQRLINLNKSIERAVGRIQGHDLIGLGTTTSATAGAMESVKVGALTAIGRALVDHPKAKAQIAIALHRARTAASKLPEIPVAKIGEAAFQGGRIKNNAPTP